jgi:hypothetical protein
VARASAMMNSSQPVTDPNAPFLNAASLHGPREFAVTWTTRQSKLLRRHNAIAEIGVPVGYRTDAGTVYDLHLDTGVAHAECIHARKRIAAAVAD